MSRKKAVLSILLVAACFVVGWWLVFLESETRPKTPMVAIVFDDAHHSLPAAASLMQTGGIVGTAYVPTGLVGKYDFHTTWDEIQKISRLGWEIGSHTVTHPNLKEIPREEAWAEIRSSRDDLVARNIPVASFAAPYGEMPPDLIPNISGIFENARLAWGEQPITREGVDRDSGVKWRLPVYDVSFTGRDASQLKNVLSAAAEESLTIVVFHKILGLGDVRPEDPFSVSHDNFRHFVEEVKSLQMNGRIRTVTVSEGVRELERRNRIQALWKRVSG